MEAGKRVSEQTKHELVRHSECFAVRIGKEQRHFGLDASQKMVWKVAGQKQGRAIGVCSGT